MAQNFARRIEKDIMTGVASNAAGTSEVVDLNGASKFSCQAVYVVSSPVGATVTFQSSNDNVYWTNIQAATTMSSSTTIMLEQPNVSYRYFRAVKALTSGDVDLKCLTLVIGDPI